MRTTKRREFSLKLDFRVEVPTTPKPSWNFSGNIVPVSYACIAVSGKRS